MTDVPHPGGSGRLQLAVLAAWAAAVLLAWTVLNVSGAPGREFEQLWPPTHPTWFNVLYATVGALVAGWLAFTAVRLYGAGTLVGRALLLLAAGVVAWAAGNTIWFWYNTCTAWPLLACSNTFETPYPSVADLGFLLLPPLYAIALWHLGRLLALRAADVVRMLWIPALIVLVTAYLTAPTVDVLGFEFGRAWLFDSSYTTTQQAVSTLYLLGDTVIMSLALMLALRARETAGGRLFTPLLLVAGSLVALYLGDMVFDQRVTAGTYANGDIADGLYALSFILMAVAFERFAAAHRALLASAVRRPTGDEVPAGAVAHG